MEITRDITDRAFELSRQTGISVLDVPEGWSVSVPVYIAALEHGVCATTAQQLTVAALAAAKDPEPAPVIDLGVLGDAP